jgi:hypothetical protein
MSETFEISEDQEPQSYRPPGMSGCAKAAIGCGVIMVFGSIVTGIAVWYITANAREFGADITAEMMKNGLTELKLPANQQQRIFARIDEVSQNFKDKKITLEQVGLIFKEIAEGPLMPAGMSLVVERAYLDKSGFEEQEKDAARIATRRFTHGTIRQMIPEQQVNSVLDTISSVNHENNREFRHPVSDEELRAFVAAAKQAADDADVPEDVPEVNFADEFDKAIDEALGKQTQ